MIFHWRNNFTYSYIALIQVWLELSCLNQQKNCYRCLHSQPIWCKNLLVDHNVHFSSNVSFQWPNCQRWLESKPTSYWLLLRCKFSKRRFMISQYKLQRDLFEFVIDFLDLNPNQTFAKSSFYPNNRSQSGL